MTQLAVHITRQPMREAGAFELETFITLNPDLKPAACLVVYADNKQPSHCVWLVPGWLNER